MKSRSSKRRTPARSSSSARHSRRREHLLVAARDIFQETGYAAASIDEIIARAGGSKGTVYSYFDSKLGLFEAVVRDQAKSFSDKMNATLSSISDSDLDIASAVERFLVAATSSEAINLLRMVIAERQKYPSVEEILGQLVPDMYANVRCLFDQSSTTPVANLSDDDADLFLAVVVAAPWLAILTGMNQDLNEGERLLRLHRRLAAFLSTLGETTGPGSSSPPLRESDTKP